MEADAGAVGAPVGFAACGDFGSRVERREAGEAAESGCGFLEAFADLEHLRVV